MQLPPDYYFFTQHAAKLFRPKGVIKKPTLQLARVQTRDVATPLTLSHAEELKKGHRILQDTIYLDGFGPIRNITAYCETEAEAANNVLVAHGSLGNGQTPYVPPTRAELKARGLANIVTDPTFERPTKQQFIKCAEDIGCWRMLEGKVIYQTHISALDSLRTITHLVLVAANDASRRKTTEFEESVLPLLDDHNQHALFLNRITSNPVTFHTEKSKWEKLVARHNNILPQIDDEDEDEIRNYMEDPHTSRTKIAEDGAFIWVTPNRPTDVAIIQKYRDVIFNGATPHGYSN